jgi:hypothetical protein
MPVEALPGKKIRLGEVYCIDFCFSWVLSGWCNIDATSDHFVQNIHC